MEKIVFTVLGSTGNHFAVSFEKDDKSVHAFCDCEAGKNGISCKHRVSLMNGEFSKIVSGNKQQLQAVKEMLRGSELEQRYREHFFTRESQHQTTKKRLDASKKALARAMYR